MIITLAILNVLQLALLVWVLVRHGYLVKAYEDLIKRHVELTDSYFRFRKEYEAFRADFAPLDNVVTLYEKENQNDT